jgi:hypothetical protein
MVETVLSNHSRSVRHIHFACFSGWLNDNQYTWMQLATERIVREAAACYIRISPKEK